MLSSEIWSHPGRPLIHHLTETAGIMQQTALSLPSTTHLEPFFTDILWTSGVVHDYAKATASFQAKLRGESHNAREALHGYLSSILAFKNSMEFLSENEEVSSKSILPLYAYLAVKRHHRNLDSAIDDLSISDSDISLFETQLDQIDYQFVEDLKRCIGLKLRSPVVNPSEVKEELPSLRKELRTYKKLLRHERTSLDDAIKFSMFFSILIDADKFDASQTSVVSRSSLPESFVRRHIENLGEPVSHINKLRTKAFHDILSFARMVNLDNRLISLTLPTGLGKTYSVLAMAQELRNRIHEGKGHVPRIIYCLPFTSIIDQNHEEISKLLDSPLSSILLKHHHLGDTLYRTDEDDEEIDYQRSELLIEGWNSEIVVTTFVQLLFTLAGCRNRPLRRLHNLAGSIVILDEVQSIPLKYWHLFNQLARTISELLDTRFILVTATQPLIFEKITEAVPNPDEYFSSLSRFNIDINLERLSFEDYKTEMLESLRREPEQDLLIILNTKKAAEEMYRSIRDLKLPCDLNFLSASVIPCERLHRINKIRREQSKNQIVVSTQVVEAGVDLSFTRVYRDFAPLDSIIQAAGRCNRHMSQKRGLFSVRNLIDDSSVSSTRQFSSYIYDSMLLDATRYVLEKNPKIAEIDFQRISNEYFREITKRRSLQESKDIISSMKQLDYRPLSDVRLIDDRGFLMTDIFIETNDEATETLEKYIRLIESNMKRFDRKTEFLKIRNDLMKYTISVYTKRLGAYRIVDSLSYIPRSELDRSYDSDTGFKTSSETALIL